jgi:hypothetical protein
MSNEYYKRCGDCGVFVPKRLWIDIELSRPRGVTHTLCDDCCSAYDEPGINIPVSWRPNPASK